MKKIVSRKSITVITSFKLKTEKRINNKAGLKCVKRKICQIFLSHGFLSIPIANMFPKVTCAKKRAEYALPEILY